MNSRTVKQAIFGVFCCFSFNFLTTVVSATEVDNGIVIVDRKPWKISWIQEGNDWILVANFDKGTLRTFFKDEPPTIGFGLSRNKKPTKQEFEFFFGKKLTSMDCQYEQWTDGAKGYAFNYQQNFERDGQQLKFGTTAIIEEVGDVENEIRYAIYKEFNLSKISTDESVKSHEDENEEDENHITHLSKLPEFEQLVHKSLTSKLDLLMIHRDFIHKQNTVLLDFMRVLEDEKDKDGYLSENRLIFLLNQSNFPRIQEMVPDIEKMKNNFFVRNEIDTVLKIVKRNNAQDINNWFEKIEKEIFEDIETYENSNLSLPQYKHCLSLYTEAKDYRIFITQMMKIMNPKVFNN